MAKFLLKRKCFICKKEWVIEKPYICKKCQKRRKEQLAKEDN